MSKSATVTSESETSRYAQVGDLRLHYNDVGHGPPVADRLVLMGGAAINFITPIDIGRNVASIIMDFYATPLRKKLIPMGRFAEMEEVASAVAYLASEEARFITGQVLSVNGGGSML